MRISRLLLLLLLLTGCAAPEIVPPPIEPHLEIVVEEQGWVQVRVTDVPCLGYTLHWGDTTAPYGTSDVVPSAELYEHFYQAMEGGSSGEQVPTQYTITLADEQGQAIAKESVWVHSVFCHLGLVSLVGRVATVRYWGRFGIDYFVSWGDQTADHFMADTETGTGLLKHTYVAAGTYSLGMQEILAPPWVFLTIVVE
ncbi:MAG: hypothetical protein PHX77_06015 [Candidatus Bipolaricaulis sp.]|nr:hypothetical protein [Candidatus Bipolaricaulis sp.]MDD5646585.1 hypothetical protein [Candidatus Bipolaricaulis sp.]